MVGPGKFHYLTIVIKAPSLIPGAPAHEVACREDEEEDLDVLYPGEVGRVEREEKEKEKV